MMIYHTISFTSFLEFEHLKYNAGYSMIGFKLGVFFVSIIIISLNSIDRYNSSKLQKRQHKQLEHLLTEFKDNYKGYQQKFQQVEDKKKLLKEESHIIRELTSEDDDDEEETPKMFHHEQGMEFRPKEEIH